MTDSQTGNDRVVIVFKKMKGDSRYINQKLEHICISTTLHMISVANPVYFN